MSTNYRGFAQKTGGGGVIKNIQRCISSSGGTSRHVPRTRSAVLHRKAVRLNAGIVGTIQMISVRDAASVNQTGAFSRKARVWAQYRLAQQ